MSLEERITEGFGKRHTGRRPDVALQFLSRHDLIGFLDRIYFPNPHVRFEVERNTIHSRGIELSSRHQ